MVMFDFFSPVVGNYSVETKCSNKMCNNSVAVPAQLNDNAVFYCDECLTEMNGVARKVGDTAIKNRELKCPKCHGTGKFKFFAMVDDCLKCDGTGKIKERYSLSKRKWVRV